MPSIEPSPRTFSSVLPRHMPSILHADTNSSSTPAASSAPAIWKKLFAGSVAGICDVVVCHPLDRIKTHMQQVKGGATIAGSAKDIFAKGGMRSLYEGVLPMGVEAIAKVSMRFYVYSYFKDLWKLKVQKVTDPHTNVSFIGNVFAGAMAGAVESMLVVIPCELLKVRAMTSVAHEPFFTTMRTTIKQDGFIGLYRGGSATLLRQVTNHMIRFPVFYMSSNYIKERNGTHTLHPLINISLGGFAGMASTLCNTPLDTIKTRMQKHGSGNQTFMGVGKEVIQESGVRGLWSGVVPRMVRVVPGQAITFFVVEFIMDMLGASM